MPEALITIGMPCYNAADTISRAIRSAQAQDWKNLEIIVVDDVSTDNSVNVVEEIKRNDPRVRLIRHTQNQGPAAARNTVMNNAQGDFICFFDDDDESLPERVRIQHTHIISYEQKTGQKLLACYASGVRVYPNGYTVDLKSIGSEGEFPKGKQIVDYIFFFKKYKNVFYGAGTPTCALMLRKETLERVGGFDPAFRRVEDLDFAVRLGLKEGHFIGCPEKLLHQHASFGDDKTPLKNFQSEIQLVEKHKDYLQSTGWYVYARDWPKIRFYHFEKKYIHMLGILISLALRYPLKTIFHFLETGSKRFLHEKKMRSAK